MLSKILLSSDHGGFELKEKVKNYLIKNCIEFEDLGCPSLEPVDYPDYAKMDLRVSFFVELGLEFQWQLIDSHM